RTEGRHHLQRGDRDLLAERQGRKRQRRPPARLPELTPALAGEPQPRRPTETERGHVVVVALRSEQMTDLDRSYVGRVLNHFTQGQPAVLLPVVDRGPGDGDRTVLTEEAIVRADDP